MTQIKFIFLLFAIIFVGATYAFSQSNVTADEKTVVYLKKHRSDYIQSMVNKKPEMMQSYYAENIRLMPEFQKTVGGKANALSYHKAFSDRFDIKSYSRNELEVLDLGERIVELGMFTMKMISKNTNKEYEIKGKYQNIWEKLTNNNISLVTEAWNYNHALEIEDQLRFDEVPEVNIALQAHVPINNKISFELAALNRLMEATIMQHDAKIWSQFYSNDGMFLYSRHPVYKGRKALDEFLEKHVKEDMPIFEKLDIRNDQIDDLGDYVIEYASHIANWRRGEYSGINTGKDIRIWRRDADCSLKIFRAMGMYD